jgi:small multidrug resistance pump
MSYVYLIIAITAEVIATTALKASEQFTRVTPSIVVAVGYLVAFYFLSLVLRTMDVGIAYAVWSGLGVVLVASVNVALTRQVPDAPAVIGMALILSGVVIANLFSKTITH